MNYVLGEGRYENDGFKRLNCEVNIERAFHEDDVPYYAVSFNFNETTFADDDDFEESKVDLGYIHAKIYMASNLGECEDFREAALVADGDSVDDCILLTALDTYINEGSKGDYLSLLARVMMINELYVYPEQRGLRRGATLLEQAIQFSIELFDINIAMLQAVPLDKQLTTHEKNALKPRLSNYYATVGFERINEDDIDDTVMVMELW